jgi:mRNA interferase MazF
MTNIYTKHYNQWNLKKQSLDQISITRIFKVREIWWCHWGCNIGEEIDGKNDEFERPAIIYCIFTKTSFWAIPLTTKAYPESSRIHVRISTKDDINTALLYQMRLISSNRLIQKIDILPFDDFQLIRRYVRDLT